MDIQKIISDIVSKVTGNSDLIQKLTSDPAATIKELTGFEVNADQIKEIINGVTKALGENAGDVLKEGEEVEVKITAIDEENKKVSLSIRALMPGEQPAPEAEEIAPETSAVVATSGEENDILPEEDAE